MTNSKLDKFLDLVDSAFDGEIETPPTEMARLQVKMNALLAEAKKLEQQSWKVNAKLERANFASELKGQIESIISQFGSTKGLMEEILNGRLGTGAQHTLQTQFRNKKPEELSEKDIRAILGDQKILELLKNKSVKK